MHVFVRRSSLTLSDQPVPVMALYEDAVTITPEMGRPEFTLLSLPGSAIRNTARPLPELVEGWRDTYRAMVAYGEAERRILDVFPEHAQRNAALELGLMATRQGDPAWLKEAQGRRAEIERAWGYVDAVRAIANRLAAGLPADPTADSHWPKRIAAYKGEVMQTNVLALPLAHLVIEASNNEDWIDTLVFMVSDSGPPLEQLDLRGIALTMHLRRRPEVHEIVLAASTLDRTLFIGSPPDVGYVIFYVPEETMRTLWPGVYVGDIVASDANFQRVVLTVEMTVLQGITKT